MRRWTASEPCVICGGHPGIRRGQGARCWGYRSADGTHAYCSRGEKAGTLDEHGDSAAYAHRLEGPCRCGIEHGIRLEIQPRTEPTREKRIADALRIWRGAHAAPRTLVASYLESRAIHLPPPSRLRYLPSLRHRDPSTGVESRWPCMIALCTDRDDQPLGIHRTWLARDGAGKATISPAKMALGPIGGGAVRLAPAAEHIAVAEGIETALSVAQLSGIPCWAALSAGGIQALELPPVVRSISIASDRDETGHHAAQSAARRWIDEGRQVEIIQPQEHNDFADLLESARSGGIHRESSL